MPVRCGECSEMQTILDKWTSNYIQTEYKRLIEGTNKDKHAEMMQTKIYQDIWSGVCPIFIENITWLFFL